MASSRYDPFSDADQFKCEMETSRGDIRGGIVPVNGRWYVIVARDGIDGQEMIFTAGEMRGLLPGLAAVCDDCDKANEGKQ